MNRDRMIARMALEYRLSLESLCKIFGLPATQENKKIVYDKIITCCVSKNDVEVFSHLLLNETVHQSQQEASETLEKAKKFIRLYKAAVKLYKDTGSKDVLLNVMNSDMLKETEIKFERLMKKGVEFPISEEDIKTIANYRIKYRISSAVMAEILGISHSTLRNASSSIKDETISRRLNVLNEYYADVANKVARRK